MNTNNFFEETTEQSVVKKTIVSKYFDAWAKVIIPTLKKLGREKLAYIDLFAGPGRYKDGTSSTPLMILEIAIQHEDMRKMLITIFNDKDENSTKTLESEIGKLPGIETMNHKPQVFHEEVGAEIVRRFEEMEMVPTLFFIDPWGYKGLSLRLINSVLKEWGSDCIIFFNYNRISMGLSNPLVREHMDALFGKERVDRLQERFETLSPADRELAIVEEIAQALKELGGKYVLPFCFKNEQGSRTSHHLIFVSKHPKGYAIMKDIMAKESSKQIQGVPSFAYCPADEQYPTLFELSRPLENLENELAIKFAGRQMTMKQIYEEHNLGTPFIERNYKDALRSMEEKGLITAKPPAAERRKIKGQTTFASSVLVKFS